MPAPSQKAAVVKVADCAGHEGPRHIVLVPHFRQAPAPLQVPSLPQLDSAAAVQLPSLSAPPAGMLLQVPSIPWSAQLLHTPVHAPSQQTPSTHWPVLHSSPLAQAPPLSLRPHSPISQRRDGMHWPSSIHELKQSVPPALHTYGLHSRRTPAAQVPSPLHVDCPVALPAAQAAAAQTVPLAYLRQAPEPLHVPSLPQLAGPWSWQPPVGSTPPAGTGVQVPALPA